MRKTYSTYLAALAFPLALAACRGDEGGASSGGGAVIENATAIKCPFPTTAKGFTSEDSKNVFETGRLFMNESQDSYGLPSALRPLTGNMQRGVSNYVIGKVFAGEKVSLWVQSASGSWEQSGATVTTDATGSYSFPLPAAQQAKGPGGHAYVLLEGDGSCAQHGVYAWPRGTKIVVTDIDGTLTTANAEFQTQVTQPSYVPKEHPSASEMIKKWAQKGYRIVFLTARPDNFRDASRVWLRDKGINVGPIITAKSFVTGPAAVSYKSAALATIVNDYGWQVVAAYGNEVSDVQAYANANVPKAQTFTVENANGIEGTIGLPGDDYAPHIANYVDKQPDATQP
jgi:hypothetical protein